MFELTVGYVAGFIALGSFVVQLWSPNTIAFILAGILQDSNTAATWSVAGRALQNTYWPDLLRVETSRIVGVRRDVVALTKLMRFMAILVAIAGTITPLGLYDQFVPSTRTGATFRYLLDTSPFGFGTPARSGLPFARKCEKYLGAFVSFPLPCPFSNTMVVYTDDGETMTADLPYSYNVSLPDYYLDVFSSGTSDNSTISNFFDIQWRQWTTRSNEYIMNGSQIAMGAYRPMQSMILNNATEPVEGLVIDTKQGSIGFRNHTIPLNFKHGATWAEDLLYVEPETNCVDTNLTLDFEVSANDTALSSLSNLVLTDRGGFANLNRTYPYYDRDDPQNNPDLGGRAYKAAWMNNAWTMLYLNVTNPNNSTYGKKSFSYVNSYVGKAFPIAQPKQDSAYTALQISQDWGGYLSIHGSDLGSQEPNRTTSYENPFHVTTDDFDNIQLICRGSGGGDIANISNIFGACGLMYGAAHRTDGSSLIAMEAGSKWSVPLYACASAVKATVKTTNFNLNGTDEQGLRALSIKEVKQKNFTDQRLVPTWGVENTGWNKSQISPIWGMISEKFANHPNISSVKKESLYLPGGSLGAMDDLSLGYSEVSYQNMPGTDFYVPAMALAYGAPISVGLRDYTGYADMGMLVRWKELAASPKTAGKIINLIWTDLAAGAVVGTKGTLGPGNSGSGNEIVKIEVQPMVKRIKYHWLFAIPAFILIFLVIVVTIIAILTSILHKANIATMRNHLFRSSAGRIYTTFMFPDYADLKMPALEWRRVVGKQEIDLGEESERVTTIAMRAARKSSQSTYESSGLMPYEGT